MTDTSTTGTTGVADASAASLTVHLVGATSSYTNRLWPRRFAGHQHSRRALRLSAL